MKESLHIGSKDEGKEAHIIREEKWQEAAKVDKDDIHGKLAVTVLPKFHPTEKMCDKTDIAAILRCSMRCCACR